MASSTLERIAADIDRLSLPDQLWLIEHLAHRIRTSSLPPLQIDEQDFAALADDPDIQRELRQIETEFALTEADGLDRLP